MCFDRPSTEMLFDTVMTFWVPQFHIIKSFLLLYSWCWRYGSVGLILKWMNVVYNLGLSLSLLITYTIIRHQWSHRCIEIEKNIKLHVFFLRSSFNQFWCLTYNRLQLSIHKCWTNMICRHTLQLHLYRGYLLLSCTRLNCWSIISTFPEGFRNAKF